MLAIATKEKGASRVNDCNAIGGLVGGNVCAQGGRVSLGKAHVPACAGRVGENRSAVDGRFGALLL